MNIEQTGPDSVKITLVTDLEKSTLGKADKLSLVIVQEASVGYTQADPKNVEVTRDQEAK